MHSSARLAERKSELSISVRSALAFEFQKWLLPMVAEQMVAPEAAVILTDKVSEILEEYGQEIAGKLQSMITDWESVMDEDDKTLYSLGLRRAVDVVTERDSTEERNVEEV